MNYELIINCVLKHSVIVSHYMGVKCFDLILGIQYYK